MENTDFGKNKTKQKQEGRAVQPPYDASHHLEIRHQGDLHAVWLTTCSIDAWHFEIHIHAIKLNT